VNQLGFVLASGLASGATYALAGAAFGLVFFVTGRFHFAFGIFYAAAGMMAAWAASYLGWPNTPAILLGLAVGTVGGVLSEVLVYRALDRRSTGSSLLGVFIASLGLVVAGKAVLGLVFNQAATFNIMLVQPGVWTVGGIAVPYVKALGVVVCWSLLILMWLLVTRTHFGRQMRAVEASPDLAAVYGIDAKRIALLVFAVASFAGAALGILYAGTVTASVAMADPIIIYAIVIAFLGRGRSLLTIGIMGEVLGVAEAAVGYQFGLLPQSLVIFVILFLFVAGGAYAADVRRLQLRRRANAAAAPAG
jgi:branched-chain amino acid transport system permease protein